MFFIVPKDIGERKVAGL